tara:strand:- start:296 stop:745 length:450 start_codon:yes stop_codon:yes gene_type:complete
MYIPRKNRIKKNIVIQRSSTTAQEIDSSVVDISGTEISYTPEANSSKVAYEFKIQYHNDPDQHNNLFYELQKDSGSGYSPLGKGYLVNMVYQFVNGQHVIEGYFILDSWSGSNNLKLTGRTYDDSREMTLHEDEAGNHFDPIIKIYSIM